MRIEKNLSDYAKPPEKPLTTLVTKAVTDTIDSIGERHAEFYNVVMTREVISISDTFQEKIQNL